MLSVKEKRFEKIDYFQYIKKLKSLIHSQNPYLKPRTEIEIVNYLKVVEKEIRDAS